MQASIGREVLLCLLLVLCWPGLGTPAEARPKTDRVTLANGDVVHGEIMGLERGYLRYSTDSMGTVMIEWDEVRAVDSNHLFRIRTQAGVRYFGAIGESDNPGYLSILHADGEEEYPALDVVAIRPIESALRDRLDTVVSAGYSDFKASDSSTTTLGLGISYEDELSVNTLQARSVVTDNSGRRENSNRLDLVRQRLWNNPRYFNYYGANWESNDELAVDSRTGLAVGAGRHFIDSSDTRLSISAGVQGLVEEDSLGDTTESVEGLVVMQLSNWRFTGPELDIESTLRMYPGITESGRFRADGSITLSWEIISDLSLNLSAFGNFDNDSNTDGDDYDYGITTGLEWEL